MSETERIIREAYNERDALKDRCRELEKELEEARELMKAVIFRHAVQDGSGLLKAVEALADWLNYDPPSDMPSLEREIDQLQQERDRLAGELEEARELIERWRQCATARVSARRKELWDRTEEFMRRTIR